MKSQGVTAVKRFRIKKDGQLKDTNNFVFTFNTPVLPPMIKIPFLRVNVEVNIPNPLRCFNCQQYGHHEDKCKNEPVCTNCGQPAIHHASLCKNPTKCANCGESHDANSKECKIWQKEKEILRVKFTRNISFPEARKAVESPTPAPGYSYANIIKPTVKQVSLTDATTQTEPVTILYPEDSSNTQSSEPHNKTSVSTTQTEKHTATENTNSSSCGQGGRKEEPVLKPATLEMMRKDWQKHQQKERQMNKKVTSPNKNKTKDQIKKPNTTDRLPKAEIKLQNKFESLSDESDMEYVDTHDNPRAGSSTSWSPILPP